MSKKTEKRVKAWTILGAPQWGSAVLESGSLARPRNVMWVFRSKKDAQAKLDDSNSPSWSVVPCTITYSLPSQDKGKKLT